MLATGTQRGTEVLQEMLIAAELASLADLVRRPGEAWLMLCGGPDIAAAELPGRVLVVDLTSASHTAGAWRGRLYAPPIQRAALDGLVLHHVSGSLHSLLGEWLPCIRPGGRLVLIDSRGSNRSIRQRWRLLAQLRRWERERWLRHTGWMIFHGIGAKAVSKDLAELPLWQRHWQAASAASLRIDFICSEQDAANAPLQPIKARRVALPLPGVSGV